MFIITKSSYCKHKPFIVLSVVYIKRRHRIEKKNHSQCLAIIASSIISKNSIKEVRFSMLHVLNFQVIKFC